MPASRNARVCRDYSKQANAVDAKVSQDRDGQPVIPVVGVKTQCVIRVDRVEAVILQFVGLQFRRQPDAAAFLVLVDHDTAALGRDSLHGDSQLFTAIAAQRSENFAGDALRVDAQQRSSRSCRIAERHHQCCAAVRAVLHVSDRLEQSPLGGHARRRNSFEWSGSVTNVHAITPHVSLLAEWRRSRASRRFRPR